jgi:hypothetical protein
MRALRIPLLRFFVVLACAARASANDVVSHAPAVVELDGEGLFTMRVASKTFTPEARAAAIRERIVELAKDFTVPPEAIPRIYSDLHKNIQDKFNEAGVEIMSPHYAQLRDGSHTTTPQQYLPPDYVPQPFRVVDTGRLVGKIDVADDDPK